MTYRHYYRTTEGPESHVEVVSETHIQDLTKHRVAIAFGNVANADAVTLQLPTRPERFEGREVVPEGKSTGGMGRSTYALGGKAIVYCFEFEHERDAFCEQPSGAIPATLYQQTETKDF